MALLRDSMLVAAVLASALVFSSAQEAAPLKPPAAVTERFETVKMVWELAETKARMGRDDFEGDADHEAYVRWSLRLADAAVVAQVMSPADAYDQHLDRMEKSAATTEVNAVRGRVSSHDIAVAKYFVADAKLALERARN